MSDKAQLKELLLTLSYQKKEIVLSSGQKSSFYFDGKQTSLHPQGAYLLGKLFYQLIFKNWPEVEAVGGPTLGADPLVSAVSITSYQNKKGIPAFIIRKEPKKHGTQAWIEGEKNLKPGMKVVLLEDVVTTGGSLIKAIQKARDAKLSILGAAVIVDREEGGREALEKEGVDFKALFTKSELIN